MIMEKDIFLNEIETFISNKKLIDKRKLYISALSGGADSVALLLSLKELGVNIEAAHCNFKLRGDESDRDEQFCIELCQKHGIKIHIIHFDTIEYAKLHKISIEMAARDLRYNYFEQLRRDIGADGICIGHHREDSVETLLLNLIRGTGINGLTGIAPKNGYILRPMLSVSRKDIENFLDRKKQNFVTDSTNLVDDATRNKIRLNLMPIIRSINPSADKDIANTALRLREAEKIFNDSLKASEKEIVTTNSKHITSINKQKLFNTASPEYTLFYILKNFNFTPSTIEEIHNRLRFAQCGKTYLSKSHRLLIDRESIIIEPQTNFSECNRTYKIPETGVYKLNDKITLRLEIKKYKDKKDISILPNIATIDADKVVFPLMLRTPQQGDWFTPFGMKGKKSVSDFLTDKKLTLFEKERQPLIEDANGNIIWLIGLRTDNRYRIKEDTKNILYISHEDSQNE